MASITYARYLDRVLGGWLGAFAGESVGSRRVGERAFATVAFDKKSLSPLAPGDATDLAVLWVHALHERGPHLTSKALVEEWRQHFPPHRAEYGIARRNWALGIQPAASGRFNNDFFGESGSAAARAFVWGLACPGAPKSAVRYARRDAELDHHGEGVEAAMFAAALAAGAFFETDIETLVHTSLHQIEGASRFARVIRDVLRWSESSKLDECLELLRLRHGTPDYTRALLNIGFVTAHLLYSKGEFESSVLGVAGCGHDAARNATLAGAIAGILTGAEKLPARWRKELVEAAAVPSSFVEPLPKQSFAALAETTCRLGMEIGSVFETRVEFSQVPPRITVLDHNPFFVKVMDVFAEHPGNPSLRWGDERDVRLKIVSRNPRRMAGIFRLAPGGDLEIRPNAFPLDIGPYETRTVEAKLAFAKKASRLPMTNLVTATFEVGKEALCKETFGITASAPWLALGPFREPVTGRGKDMAEYAAYLEIAGFDKKWLPEPGIDEKTKPKAGVFFERTIVFADSDVIPLDAVFSPTGPCTLYLVAYVHAPSDRKGFVWLGTNDDAKLWLNGKLVAGADGRRFFSPFTAVEPVRLKKGSNALLLKVARGDRHFAVRLGFKHDSKEGSFESPWMTDLSYERIEG